MMCHVRLSRVADLGPQSFAEVHQQRERPAAVGALRSPAQRSQQHRPQRPRSSAASAAAVQHLAHKGQDLQEKFRLDSQHAGQPGMFSKLKYQVLPLTKNGMPAYLLEALQEPGVSR
jgi:hypothetical protein